MPGKVKVKIISGRNLPVMDRSSDTTDAYVEIKLGTTTFKTDVCRKSLHPQWNSEWYRFELDDAELQDEPLQIRLMDHDTYSANDAIGKVYLDLNPLLLPVTSLLGKWNDGNNSCHEGNSSVMSGWIPVYDTMHGIRGEVNVIVKVELFTDFNKFRQSSCGVQFFCSPAIPHGFYAQVIQGFVEELVVNDDPEYQWIDKIRTPRASNEARQTLFCKLSGELQRRIGLKALEMGGNAVIGYNQSFDLEGESGIVARGIGTAVTLIKLLDLPSPGTNAECGINEERAQSYLKFLGSAKGFYLTSNKFNYYADTNIANVTNFNLTPPFKSPSPTASIRLLKERRILRPETMPPFLPQLSRHLSDREFNYPVPMASLDSIGVHPESMMHHSVSLQTLLKQEDQRGRPGYGISQRIKNLKYSSQNMLTRKMIALKAKLGNDTGSDDGHDGKRMKYGRTQSDNTGMAEILVRSVFHAATSLDCIAESPKPQPKSVEEEAKETQKERSYLSLPIPTSPNFSCNSSTADENEDDDDDDDDDDEEDDDDETSNDQVPEMDTVSHIVETVRKLSIIQAPIQIPIHHNRTQSHLGEDPDNQEQEYDGNKFLFMIGDSEPGQSGLDEDIEVGNLLYYQDQEEDLSSFAPEFAKRFQRMNKSSSAKSLTEPDLKLGGDGVVKGLTLNRKFTSLHNIHHSESKWNKYSAHGGKETVLGELFRRIDSDNVYLLEDIEEVHEIKEEIKKLETEDKDPRDSEHLKLIIPPVKIGQLSDTSDKLLTDQKSHHKKFIPKKVIHVLKKLDNKFHQHKTLKVDKTSSKQSPPSEGTFHFFSTGTKPELSQSHQLENIPHLPGHSHVFDLEDPKSLVLARTDEEKSLERDKHNHGLIHYLKEGKEKLIHVSEDLYHKIHDATDHKEKEGIKNDCGLLNIALGNVLMDSVQDVLATSSPDSQFTSPEFTPGVGQVPDHSAKEDSLQSTQGIEDSHSYGFLDKLKGGKGKLLHAPKDLLHRIDSRIHVNHDKSMHDHGLLNIALGNVLMDSVQDILATSSPGSQLTSPDQGELPGYPSKEDSLKSTKGSEDPHSHGFLEKLKEGKEKLFHGPKELFHSLDSKIYDHHDKLMNEDGLLNIALGNVLMDSVQEVLATSHSSTPTLQTVPPYPLPFLQPFLHPDTSESSKPPLINHTNRGPPLNTQIEGGINPVHACLTNFRTMDPPQQQPPLTTYTTNSNITTQSGPLAVENGHHRTESLGVRISHSPAKINAISCIHRRSSDSDLSITPKGNSLTGSDRSGGYSSGQHVRAAMIRTTRPQENFDIMEYPFLTLSKYPPGFIAHIGGSVSARSVKLLERISNLEEPESRDTWWSEIRMEIRSHARALNCNAVLGYTESTSICDDVCVLSASGTAAVLGFPHSSSEAAGNLGGLPLLPKNASSTMTTSLDRNDFENKTNTKDPKDVKDSNNSSISKDKTKLSEDTIKSTLHPCYSIKNKVASSAIPSNTSPVRDSSQLPKLSCSISHLPYISNSKPLRSSSIKCCTCGAFKVPDMLIATIEIPEGMPNFGRGCFIQSYVCRPLKDLKGESNAKEISDGLPFLEYELHRFLINKLKVKGMNAIFGLKVRISVGERMLIGIATGTAVFLSSLPAPLLPKLVSDRTTDEKKLTQLQKDLHDTIRRNREIYQLRSIEEVNGECSKLHLESDGSEDETPGLDLSSGNKDCCILEVDDPDDADVLKSLMEPRPPDGFHVVNTELVPGLEDLEIVKNLQMFTQIWRAKIPPPFDLDKHFHRLLQSVYFKLRRMIPCALCDLQFRVDSPEPDEIQLCVLGMALGLGDPVRNVKKRKLVIPKRSDDDLIFNLEEDQIPEHSVVQIPSTHLLQAQALRHRQKSPTRNKLTKQRHVPYRERHGVDITPLSYVPGGKIEKYLGNLNFFFIRETTSLREEGGLSGFVHSFVTEILAIVRAHVTALGGNAMVAYFITECVLNHNLHKNQGQCLINVGGDVVYVSYFTEDH